MREVAEVFAKLHALTAPDSLHLPPLTPFENAAHRIEINDWLTPEDRTFLIDRLAELQSDYAGLEFVLPPGVIHGDASIGNVLRDRQGNPVVIDLDGFAIGPREWDVVLTAIYYDSFGWHTREEYETFVRVYGFDIMTWPGYPVLREIREFLMVTWVIQKASENERTAARGPQAHCGTAKRGKPKGLATLLAANGNCSRERLLAKYARPVGHRRSPGTEPCGHPVGSARVDSHCGQPWWSAITDLASSSRSQVAGAGCQRCMHAWPAASPSVRCPLVSTAVGGDCGQVNFAANLMRVNLDDTYVSIDGLKGLGL